MRTRLQYLFDRAVIVAALALSGCSYGPMQAPTSAGMVIYTEGAQHHTATVQIALPPPDVYAGMLRILDRMPELSVIHQDRKRYMLEVTADEKRLTGQATPLDTNSTLLFIWADAGNSGLTGQDLSLRAMREICAELNVECKMDSR